MIIIIGYYTASHDKYHGKRYSDILYLERKKIEGIATTPVTESFIVSANIPGLKFSQDLQDWGCDNCFCKILLINCDPESYAQGSLHIIVWTK